MNEIKKLNYKFIKIKKFMTFDYELILTKTSNTPHNTT